MTTCTTNGCDRPVRSLGWCNSHYEYWRLHDGRWPLSVEQLDPFWRNVAQDGDCWIWHGTVSTVGYGKYGAAGLPAHRRAYELMVGQIPAGLQLDHLCRVPLCVNPNHLEPVTPKINVRRKDLALGIGSARTQCPQGHPYSSENTAVRNGRRHCKACARDRARRNQPRREEQRRARRALGLKVT
jgi:hypothetical protein